MLIIWLLIYLLNKLLLVINSLKTISTAAMMAIMTAKLFSPPATKSALQEGVSSNDSQLRVKQLIYIKRWLINKQSFFFVGCSFQNKYFPIIWDFYQTNKLLDPQKMLCNAVSARVRDGCPAACFLNNKKGFVKC